MAALGYAAIAVGAPPETNSAAAESAAALACPSGDFARFLDAFAENVAMQEAFTRFPLRKRAVVDADPEPKSVETALSRAEAMFPVLPPRARRAEQGLQLRVVRDGTADLFKPDTGWRVKYVFEREDGCWRLVFIDDQSM